MNKAMNKELIAGCISNILTEISHPSADMNTDNIYL